MSPPSKRFTASYTIPSMRLGVAGSGVGMEASASERALAWRSTSSCPTDGRGEWLTKS